MFVLIDICVVNDWDGRHIYRKVYKRILPNTIEGDDEDESNKNSSDNVKK